MSRTEEDVTRGGRLEVNRVASSDESPVQFRAPALDSPIGSFLKPSRPPLPDPVAEPVVDRPKRLEVIGKPAESVPSKPNAKHEHHLIPMSLATASDLVDRFHRHNSGLPLAVFAIGLACEGEVVGAAIVGMPATKSLMDGYTVEIRRVVVVGEHPNGNSQLYGAAWRAAQALGYKRMFTYTLDTESASSPKAVGMTVDRTFTNDSFESWEFYRKLKGVKDPLRSPPPDVPKNRWVITTADWAKYAAFARLTYPEGILAEEGIGTMEGEW